MKGFWTLAAGAFVVLGAAAVWMGGLNQDEGWYLYAANMVAEGKLPYRDFAYTQGPLMPFVYSAFAFVWRNWGLLGARILTLAIGTAGLFFAAALAARLVPEPRRREAALVAFLLLGSNIYHLYYLAIPKTYALASLFVSAGFYLLCIGVQARHTRRHNFAAGAGLCLAFAAGTRVSLGALLLATGVCLLFARRWRTFAAFAVAGAVGLAIVYGPFLADAKAFSGLVAAQRYHASRGGFDIVWTVGSVSRLVRWYLPTAVLVGLWAALRLQSQRRDGGDDMESASRKLVVRALLLGFLAVFAIQMLAPFPYEDYQVPVMGLLAVAAAAETVRLFDGFSVQRIPVLLALGMSFACSFGSPLLEKWSTNGQDRFWSIKKQSYELPQLRAVAAEIESLDPGGKTLLTQDLYLAVETGRKVPEGLEMGPFSVLSDVEWRAILTSAPCRVAALSGYSFAVNPPVCDERPVEQQMEYWGLLKKDYELVRREESFGQNATPLLILRRK